MAQRAPLLLSTILASDHLTTSATVGVDRTFAPVGAVANGVSRWEERSGGIYLGFPTFTLACRAPSKTSRVHRVSMKLSVPVLETVTASTASGIVPTQPVAYSHQFHGEFLLPDRGTLAERNALLSLVISCMVATIKASDAVPSDLTASPLLNAIQNFDPPY